MLDSTVHPVHANVNVCRCSSRRNPQSRNPESPRELFMQALVDDWGFAEAAFVGVAGRAFQLLAEFLLHSATELDSQLQVQPLDLCSVCTLISAVSLRGLHRRPSCPHSAQGMLH